jgi:PTH2 family peptidyl-tRNA hydrolase
MKQVIVMRHDLNMRMGKAIAQGAHASMLWLANIGNLDLERLERWSREGICKIVVRVESQEELETVAEKAKSKGLLVHVVIDAGITEFHGTPTLTCCAIGPEDDEKIDEITKDLRLL